MTDIWYSIGHFLQSTFNMLLVPFGWFPVYLFMVVLAFGAVYWMNLQGRYNRRARERNEGI